MRPLTRLERIALREVGPPDEGPVPEHVFEECIRMGWGYWGLVCSDDGKPEVLWCVTEKGRAELALAELSDRGGS